MNFKPFPSVWPIMNPLRLPHIFELALRVLDWMGGAQMVVALGALGPGDSDGKREGRWSPLRQSNSYLGGTAMALEFKDLQLDHRWRVVEVELGERSYRIEIGPGLLTDLALELQEMGLGHRYALITDSQVHDLLGMDLERQLQEAGIGVDTFVFPAGEQSKTMETVVELAREMVRGGMDRHSAIIALGGGVVGDIAGFLASIYMRGIPFVQVPTTLLAQVDSSVGGKTGVDLPEGKNLLGTFYQPARVIADVGVLATLPRRELGNGLAEMVKYGMIWSPSLFELLEDRWWDLVNLEPELLVEAVAQSCSIKAQVVAQDEREGGLRRILNFGHTIGHAVEAASNFAIAHGEAVAMGMVAAAHISVARGLMSREELERLRSLLLSLELPVSIPRELEGARLLSLMRHDKKAVAGRIHFVLTPTIGETVVVDDVEDREILGAVEATRRGRGA